VVKAAIPVLGHGRGDLYHEVGRAADPRFDEDGATLARNTQQVGLDTLSRLREDHAHRVKHLTRVAQQLGQRHGQLEADPLMADGGKGRAVQLAADSLVTTTILRHLLGVLPRDVGK
jgi:hypothetical protein